MTEIDYIWNNDEAGNLSENLILDNPRAIKTGGKDSHTIGRQTSLRRSVTILPQ
jgi:hypothetical protein